MTVVKDVEAGVENEPPATPLKHRVFRAGGWTLVGHFLSLSLRLMSSIILTRIFSPDTFGLLAIITAVTTVIGLLTDIGLRQSIIRSPNGDNPVFRNTAWAVQVLRGLIVWGLCVIVAGGLHIAAIWQFVPADSVYAQPRLPGLIIVSSFSAVILGFTSMKTYTASRDLNLQRVTLFEIFSQFFGLILIVLLGWLTRSIWSYVAGLLACFRFHGAAGPLWAARAERSPGVGQGSAPRDQSFRQVDLSFVCDQRNHPKWRSYVVGRVAQSH